MTVRREGTAKPRVRSASSAGDRGWSAAALLSRARGGMPHLLVRSSAIPTVGVGGHDPADFDFLRNIGADEIEFIRRCQATFSWASFATGCIGHAVAPFGNLGVTITSAPSTVTA